MSDSITYCRGHGWQVLAGVEVPRAEVEECPGCVVVTDEDRRESARVIAEKTRERATRRRDRPTGTFVAVSHESQDFCFCGETHERREQA